MVLYCVEQTTWDWMQPHYVGHLPHLREIVSRKKDGCSKLQISYMAPVQDLLQAESIFCVEWNPCTSKHSLCDSYSLYIKWRKCLPRSAEITGWASVTSSDALTCLPFIASRALTRARGSMLGLWLVSCLSLVAEFYCYDVLGCVIRDVFFFQHRIQQPMRPIKRTFCHARISKINRTSLLGHLVCVLATQYNFLTLQFTVIFCQLRSKRLLYFGVDVVVLHCVEETTWDWTQPCYWPSASPSGNCFLKEGWM